MVALHLVFVFWLLAAAFPAAAQDAPPVRVRGTIERVDGAVYVVKTRDGAELKIAPAEKSGSPIR